MSKFSLNTRVALVTGGGSGLGKGVCEALADEGASIVVTDMNEAAAKAVAAELSQRGVRALGYQMDVTDSDAMKRVFEGARAEFGKVDILVNNAGYTMIQNVLDIAPQDNQRVFDINVFALFNMTKMFAEYLKADGMGGNVVNIASVVGRISLPGQLHYGAAKAAVMSMTQSFAKELAPYQINVNAVCPGGVDTAMLRYCMDRAIEKSGDPNLTVDDLRAAWGAEQIGRLIQPIEVGRVVAFLSSDAAHIVRGQSINVDAGTTA